MNFEKELEARVKYANVVIENNLPKEKTLPGELVDAMKYSVLAGGKRIRPVLMKEAYNLFGGTGTEIEPFMASMEYIHTAALVHDDLPTIDNDMFRRGVKTTHAYFGEALAVLAGDALLNYAYEELIQGILNAKDRDYALKAARIIAVKSGYRGLLGGQGVDVENEKRGLDIGKLDTLNYIYKQKTASIIEAALMAGAALAGAPEEMLGLLEQIGEKIGLAFQIQDDILDVTGSTQTIGKSVFSDLKNEKETYVTLLGVEEAIARVNALTEEGTALLDALPGNTEFLREFFQFLASRRK